MTWRRRAGLAGAGVASGVAVTLSIPPVGVWILAPVGLGLLYLLIEGRPALTRGLLGLAAGIGLFGPSLFWASEFSVPGYLAMVVVEAAMVGVGCALVPPRRGRALAFAPAVALVEAARDAWPFGGLPLGGIALGQAAGPLAPAARLGGTVLVAALVGAAGVALAEGARALRRRPAALPRLGVAAMAAAVVVAGAGVGAAAPDGGPAVGRVRAALVQGGGVRGLSQSQVDPQTVFLAHLGPSLDLRPPLDLVLWPEDVIALDGPLEGSDQAAQVSALASSLHATVVAGVTEDVGASAFRNEAVAWGPSGAVVARYEKVHRVPFGEYVPLRGLFRHLANLSEVPRDAIPGHGSGLMATPAAPLSVMVSYEVFFPSRGRDAVRAGAELMVVPTNTSSYSAGQVPAQEVAASRLQAIAGGRDLLQAAPTGYSAVVDNEGRVLARSSLGSEAVIRAGAPLRRGQTVFVRFGEPPVVVAAILLLAAAWCWAALGRRAETTEVGDGQGDEPGSVLLVGDSRRVEGGHLAQDLGRGLKHR
jgi:apolipoprotein N-acyltransferase